MATSVERSEPTDAVWKAWADRHADLLGNSLGPQRVLLEAAVRFVATIAGHPIMTRLAAFFLVFRGGGSTDLDVYNDRLAVDKSARIAYFLAPGFRSLVNAL